MGDGILAAEAFQRERGLLDWLAQIEEQGIAAPVLKKWMQEAYQYLQEQNSHWWYA
jgi:hypothetical protein